MERYEVGIHWLRLSFPKEAMKSILTILTLKSHFGDDLQHTVGRWSFDQRYQWNNGGSLNYDKDGNELHRNQITLDIPGGFFDDVGTFNCLNLLDELNRYSPVCRRLDVYFDDFRRLITPEALEPYARRKDLAGFSTRGSNIQYTDDKLTRSEVNFGRRGSNGSGKYMRIYDKNLESGGTRNCIRWECEFSGHKAITAFQELMNAPDKKTVLHGLVFGSIVFFEERAGETHLSRCVEAEFYRTLREGVELIKITGKLTETDVDKYRAWHKKFHAPGLAMLQVILKAEGSDIFEYIGDMLIDGENRLSEKHITMIKQYFNRAVLPLDAIPI